MLCDCEADARPDFVRSPTKQTFNGSPLGSAHDVAQHDQLHDDPEPLLELFAQAHPWVGGTINGTINGSVYAYNTTKHYSPRFIQYGANLVERNIASPVVNTVGTVGRFTGVEDGLRRYLGARRSSDLERGDGVLQKRAPAGDAYADVEMGGCDNYRRDSFETLPAYRASKPPSYREDYSPAVTDRDRGASRPPYPRSWSSQVAGQVFVMTSGLGVALSVTSRRSLQFCLSLLSQATEHVATVMNALKMVLEQYDQARASWHRQRAGSMEKGDRPRTPEHDEAARRLADLIKQHCDDIWQTLKTVVNTVSTSTGGALPENARHFVRTQLMSLPQRWRLVSEQSSGESETSRGAHRMIAFATEGLDMMSQVSQVVKATLDSAERWLERVGRRGADRPFYHEKNHSTTDAGFPYSRPS